MKRLFTLCTLLFILYVHVCAANITGGTVLYLDASQAWTGYSNFSAYFWSNSSNGNYVEMTAVGGENRIWKVVTPSGNWTNVIFRCHNTASGSSTGTGTFVYQTDQLTWSGTMSLYAISCDNCGNSSSLGNVAKGTWKHFITMPTAAPSTLPNGEVISACIDSLENVSIQSGIQVSEFINYQWFKHENGAWARIEGGNSITAPMPTTAGDTTYYYLVAQRIVGNKIVNPGFESGNTGFTSDYNYVTPNGSSTLYPEGAYTITNDVSSVHTSAKPGGYDHTTGNSSGHMMAVNGDSNTGKIVWEQTVNNIQPNTNYVFSAWVMNWDQENANMAQLEFSINGELQGGRFSPVGGYYHWTQLYTTWNSGSASSVTIKLVNQQGATKGNDFAIDDICFSEIEEYTILKKLVVRSCEKCESDLVYAKWEDVLFCNNGDDRFVAYQWYKDNIKLDGENKQYLYLPEGMGENEYYVEATDKTGVRHMSCPKKFGDTPRSADKNGAMKIIQKGPALHVECESEAILTVYDVAGKQLMQRAVSQAADVELPHIAGTYIVYLQSEEQYITQKLNTY